MRYAGLLAAAFMFSFSGCGGGGGSDNNSGSTAPTGPTLASIQGTWYGTLEDQPGVLHTVSVTFGSTGNVTQVLLDGANAGLTGTVTKSGTNAFGGTFSDGTVVGFLVDAGATHLAFIDDSLNVGVMQKGASSLPTYGSTDIAGSWSGFAVSLDASLAVVESYASTATVTNTGSLSGSDKYGTYTGTFSLTSYDPTYGRWMGTFTQGTTSGFIGGFLSADGHFAGSYACPNSYTNFFTDCGFVAWNK